MAHISRNLCFQLKADFLPMTTLKMARYEVESFRAQLESTVLKAPHYFTNAPIIVDFSGMSGQIITDVEMKQLVSLMREYQMIPVAVRSLPGQTVLPNLSETVKAPEKPKSSEVKPLTKMVTKPVRAGTQIYAKGADLVIVAPVNAGAEVIADGNIHIYGPLRGRALAGANGDVNARIFCHDLDEAELISIAGHYLLSDQMQSLMQSRGMAHVFLENETMQIEMI